MKFSLLLQLTAATSAFVLPNPEIFGTLQAQSSDSESSSINEALSSEEHLRRVHGNNFDEIRHEFRKGYQKYAGQAYDSLDEALSYASRALDSASHELTESYFDAKAWIESKVTGIPTFDNIEFQDNEKSKSRPRKGRPGHGHKSNRTVYQLISESKYTTKLTKLINDYPDIVKALNDTEAHYTVFAPTDRAFEKIPDHSHKPSKEFLEKVLLYHVSPEMYPARRILVSKTVPTLLKTSNLSDEKVSQRLATEVSLRGLTVNFYSRIVAVNIFGSNGVIHGVDSILLPPPPALKIIDLVPEEFSTLELGLLKTGLFTLINETEHKGGTLFAPSNFAFQKLGPRVNAFLFSPGGLKYLKALLEYHIVPDQTLYSDHYIDGRGGAEDSEIPHKPRGGPPRGYKHYDLLTLLKKSLAVDVSRYGRFIDISINAYTHVLASDLIARDGVIHQIGSVLIPPHSHGEDAHMWDNDGEMSVEDLVKRLEPVVDEACLPEEL